MGMNIKYRGIAGQPILNTPSGRYQAGLRTSTPDPRGVNVPKELYAGSRDSELKIKVRQAMQEQILEQARSKAEDLNALIKNLHPPDQDIISKNKTALSTEPDALSAQADSEAAAPAIHTVEVRYPAQGGQYLSKQMNPVEEISLDHGEHTFYLFIDGTEHELTVKANNEEGDIDTQEEFLGRLARVINGQDPSVQARLEYSETDAYMGTMRTKPMDRQVRLVVESRDDGRGKDFYFADSEGGSLVADYNLDAGRPPRYADIRLGGVMRSRENNDFSLDKGHVTGMALDSTKGTAEILVERGSGVIKDELTEIIVQYNDLVSFLERHADMINPSLKDRVIRPLEDRAREFTDIGLEASIQGRLGIGDSFYSTIDSDYERVSEVMVEEDSWLDALSVKLEQILDMDAMDFAAPLNEADEVELRRRAWSAVRYLSRGIINSYA